MRKIKGGSGIKRKSNKDLILAIDQGTTGTRAVIYNDRLSVLSSSYKEFPQYFPKPGWVEHDALEIWASTVAVIKNVIGSSRINIEKFAAIGITNQRETTVLWDKETSKPVHRAIVWQCRRTSDLCASKSLQKYKNVFRKKTGLFLDPYFSGTKIKWLLDNNKNLRRLAENGRLCFGTIDSWLIWKLTNGASHVTDMTNASRTLIFNIQTLKWDKQLLKILNIPPKILPLVQKPGSIFGLTSGKETGLPAGIPIASVLGDQQAALYGQGCYQQGSIKNTYGTGSFIVLNTGEKIIYSKKGLLTTVASDQNGNPVYALEGSIFIAGAAIQWLRDQLKCIKFSNETEGVIKSIQSTDGVYFVPAFSGLGTPYWDSEARGIICGLTRGSSYRHITRAALESIAYQTKDVIDIMRMELSSPIKELKVDGGACQNNFLMQFQADILNCKVLRPKVIELTALGTAKLAGVTIGLLDNKNLRSQSSKYGKVFNPKMNSKDRGRLYAGWLSAVRKAIK